MSPVEMWGRLRAMPTTKLRIVATIIGGNIAVWWMLTLVSLGHTVSEGLAAVILGFFAAMGGWDVFQHKSNHVPQG